MRNTMKRQASSLLNLGQMSMRAGGKDVNLHNLRELQQTIRDAGDERSIHREGSVEIKDSVV